jgi:hypothetical protein
MKTILRILNSLSKRKTVPSEFEMDFTVDYARFNGFISVP